MRLCRRHGWVRACLQSGELSMTAAAQLETTFAGAERAERAERQGGIGHRNVGQGGCRDHDHDFVGQTTQLGLPAARSESERAAKGSAGTNRRRSLHRRPASAPMMRRR